MSREGFVRDSDIFLQFGTAGEYLDRSPTPLVFNQVDDADMLFSSSLVYISP